MKKSTITNLPLNNFGKIFNKKCPDIDFSDIIKNKKNIYNFTFSQQGIAFHIQLNAKK